MLRKWKEPTLQTEISPDGNPGKKEKGETGRKPGLGSQVPACRKLIPVTRAATTVLTALSATTTAAA